ncbi:hypothetical protein M885DRAFT_508831, partial [Pelagophyceae sp. CCMP2097]
MRPSAACATLARPSASPAAAARAATAASAAPRTRSVSDRMSGAASSATSASAALSTAGSMTRASMAAATRARSGPTLADADATPARETRRKNRRPRGRPRGGVARRGRVPRRVSMPRTAARATLEEGRASKTSGSEKRHFFEASHSVACRATSAATAKTSKRAHVDSTKASPAGAPRPSPRTARGAPRVGSEAPSPIVASFHRSTPTHAIVSAQSKGVSRLSSADSGSRASDTTLRPRADTALRSRAGTDTAVQ